MTTKLAANSEHAPLEHPAQPIRQPCTAHRAADQTSTRVEPMNLLTLPHPTGAARRHRRALLPFSALATGQPAAPSITAACAGTHMAHDERKGRTEPVSVFRRLGRHDSALSHTHVPVCNCPLRPRTWHVGSSLCPLTPIIQ